MTTPPPDPNENRLSRYSSPLFDITLNMPPDLESGSSFLEKFTQCAREHGLPFVTSAVTGAATKYGVTILVKFALSALVTTLPVAVAPVVVPILSAVLIGSLTGGLTKCIKNREWSWRNFRGGAAVGALGGLAGGVLTDIFQADGFLHHLFFHNAGQHVTGAQALPIQAPKPSIPDASRATLTAPPAVTPDATSFPTTPDPSNVDQLKKFIDSDAFDKVPSIWKQKARDAVMSGNPKRIAARLADLAYLESLKKGYNCNVVKAWDWAAKIIGPPKDITDSTSTAARILAGKNFLRHIHKLELCPAN